MGEICVIDVAEVTLALLLRAWEGAGCPAWLLRWHSTQKWGRHSCFQEGAVQTCRWTKTQLSLDSRPRFPGAWISIMSLSLSAVLGAPRSFWSHGNGIILQIMLRESHGVLPIHPHPKLLHGIEESKSVPWNPSFQPVPCPLADGRCCTLSCTPPAASSPSGCTPAPPPAPTCVCLRRGWHQAY